MDLDPSSFDGITAAHHPVFYNLDRDGTRLTELAARAGITHQSMGELVAALVDSGYLRRVPDPGDRRARLVGDTPIYDVVVGNGDGQVPGCTKSDCAAAFNAGIDVFNVPEDWSARAPRQSTAPTSAFPIPAPSRAWSRPNWSMAMRPTATR